MYGGSDGNRGPDSGENVLYYITLYNEPYQQPQAAGRISTSRVCCKGIYKLSPAPTSMAKARAQLLASGVGVRWALEAQQLLAADWDVAADVWSVTSWTELRPRRARGVERARLLDPVGCRRTPYVTEVLAASPGPVIATSDYAARGAEPDRPVGARRLSWRSAPTASASPTPGRPLAGTS